MDPDAIAYLIPSYGNSHAQQTIKSLQNANLLAPSLPPSAIANNTTSLNPSTPYASPALRLTLTHTPSPEGFLLGTDPACDVVLPQLPGISRRHCYITFDAGYRLVLRDVSKNGTAVWFGHRCEGDRRGAEWVLGGEGKDEGRVVVDVQGVRFQIVVNQFAADREGYRQRVDDFLARVAERESVAPPLFSGLSWGRTERERERAFIKHTFLDEGKGPQTFLWNVARPWDPVIPVHE